ncbi:MAG: hypothetical protein ACTHKV_10655, partial [Flavipsychrobacter sp.]
FWKLNTAGNNAAEKVSALGVNHFYIHFMDIDWDAAVSMPIPKAQLFGTLDTAFTNKDCTPVVFITNAVFQHISPAQSDELAKHIATKLVAIAHSQHITSYNEVQIDCDWTPGTKEKYFRFLQKIKQEIGLKKLSATIRLYPYKYPGKAGVPPVDKGVLMCYNIGGINTPLTQNSILNLSQFKTYMNAGHYPLPLDIALPVFGWYAWFRGNSFKGIVYEGEEYTSQYFFYKATGNSYIFSIDTAINGRYFREGDLLRREYLDEKELEQVATLVTKKIPSANRIIFYYWNADYIHKYENIIREIYNRY